MPPYRYRIATARFPLFPPPPVYPRGAVIRRFAIGAILVAVFVFVWFFLLLGSMLFRTSVENAAGYALIAALVCAAPVSVCGVVLARLQCCRNLRGLLLAALAGALSWCGIVICFNHAHFDLFDLYAALFFAAVSAVIALIALPNSPTIHRCFKHSPSVSAILKARKLRSIPMEKTTQKLVIIAVICAILLIALQLFDGLVHDRAHYADIAQQNVATQVDAQKARATLADRLDLYRLAERSSKYAVLFLLITFGGCFLFETLRGLRIHPVQYTLVGAAVCIFYLLLLSLGEYTGFTAAYLIAALACNSLITGYLSVVLGGLRRAAILGGLLLTAYAVLYLLLQTSRYTLLIGSLLLFAALAATMYGTRHFDWYTLKNREDA
ncbi:MAG: inner membrane CreD family protein [Cardiobacterium sp.]